MKLIHFHSIMDTKSIIFLCVNILTVTAWNFSEVNLPDDVLIWRFALWKNRAYLAVPRWENGANNSVTLLEAPWIDPETTFLMNIPQPPVTAFPNTKIQSLKKNVCNNIISVTGLDVDTRGRLWILDAPPTTINCPAKIIIYDLHRKEEVCRTTLNGVVTNELKTLVVDPVVGVSGYYAYIGDPGDETIIVYNVGRLNQRKWWKLRLLRSSTIPHIFTSDLTISKKNSRLYITGSKSLDLFSINLSELRNSHKTLSFVQKKKIIPRNISTIWHGEKMGVSSGLLSDTRDGLHYFLISEYASVRWDTKHNLKAANHAILLQNEQVLSITDYRMDSFKNVWGLVNARYPFYARKDTNVTKKWTPTTRIIQIQHNKY